MSNFTIKRLFLTLCVLMLLAVGQVSAQCLITLSDVQGSRESTPYIIMDSVNIYEDHYEYCTGFRWTGIVSFEASGYSLPMYVGLTAMDGQGRDCWFEFNEVPDSGLFIIPNVEQGTYVLQVEDEHMCFGVVENVTVGAQNTPFCDNFTFGHYVWNFDGEDYFANSARVFLTDGNYEAMAFDSISWRIYNSDSTLVYSVDPSMEIDYDENWYEIDGHGYYRHVIIFPKLFCAKNLN